MQRAHLVAACLLLLSTGGCWQRAAPEPDLVVGVGSTSEQRVLAALAERALEVAGRTASRSEGLGDAAAVRAALLAGEVDLVWDYTGAALAGAATEAPLPPAPAASYDAAVAADVERDLVWLGASSVNATFALYVRQADRPRGGPADLTWLAGELSEGGERLCADADFLAGGGLDALLGAYPVDRERLRTAPAPEERAIERVVEGSCFAGLATATSPSAAAAGLVHVADHLQAFPAFVVAPVARGEAVREHPGLEEALAPVLEVLGAERLASLVAEVEAGEAPDVLAERMLG